MSISSLLQIISANYFRSFEGLKATYLISLIILGLLILPNNNIFAQNLSGSWTIDILIDSSPQSTHSWTLAQSSTNNVVVIKGSGNDSSASFGINGTYTGTGVTFVYSYKNSNFIIAFSGNITGDNSMSGEWFDSNGQSGTWIGNRLPVAIVPVTPSYKIKEPPAVIVIQSQAMLLLQQFSGVASLSAKASKATLRYAVEISRVTDQTGKNIKKEIIKKITKKNILTLNNLKPGSYNAKYKIEIIKKQNGQEVVTGQTKFSPTASFSIIN